MSARIAIRHIATDEQLRPALLLSTIDPIPGRIVTWTLKSERRFVSGPPLYFPMGRETLAAIADCSRAFVRRLQCPPALTYIIDRLLFLERQIGQASPKAPTTIDFDSNYTFKRLKSARLRFLA